jgi:hypothetical protein
MSIKNVLALFGAVMLFAGLVAWQLHVPEGPTANSVIYAQDSNYLKDLAPGTAGQFLKTNGANAAPSWASAPVATGAGLTITTGTITLDGSNPSTAAHGLTQIYSCAFTDRRSAAPGDEVMFFTYTTSPTLINLYAWTNTSGTDPTLVASSDNNDVVDYLCIGS